MQRGSAAEQLHEGKNGLHLRLTRAIEKDDIEPPHETHHEIFNNLFAGQVKLAP
jgi:hypothetical protein